MNQKRLTPYFAGVLLSALAACSGGADEAVQDDPAAAVEATSAAPEAAGSLVDPDLATREQLLAVPGMDAASADALIAGRPYATMTEVDAVLANVPEAQRKEAYVTLWKPIDLNTATEAEIMLIPGMTARMAHEFDEYRPYAAIDRFRTEIGKYVDAAEVARLERYVAIK